MRKLEGKAGGDEAGSGRSPTTGMVSFRPVAGDAGDLPPPRFEQ
jgi:hypothetical protein